MPFQSLIHSWKVIRHNGGLFKSLQVMFFRDDLKIGRFIGEDDYGNKYYENNRYFFGRNRWVNYPDHVGLQYDPSQVPAEWFGWLHYRTDLPPHEEPFRPKYPWMARHTENMTGTAEEFVPYSTTRPKIHAWRPPRPEADCCFRFRPPRDDPQQEVEQQCVQEEEVKPTPFCDD